MHTTTRILIVAATLLGARGNLTVDVPQEGIEALIEPYVSLNLGFAVDGMIEAVEVERGDVVRAEQVIARLESSVEELSVGIATLRAEAEAQIKSAEATLRIASKSRERNEKLFKKRIVSEEVLEEAQVTEAQAEAQVLAAQEARAMAKVELARASAALALRTIRSPIDGIVVERFLSPGELVNRTSQIQVVRIDQLDPLRVEVIAPLSLIGTVRVGSEARVFPEEPIGGSYTARVTIVDKVVDAASGTFGIRLELPNPDYVLPSGLKCTVVFGK